MIIKLLMTIISAAIIFIIITVSVDDILDGLSLNARAFYVLGLPVFNIF